MLLLWFILVVIVRPLSVRFWLLFIFRIALRPSAGKDMSFWLSVCAVLLYAVLIVSCWCLGPDVEFDCIGSWSFMSTLLFKYIWAATPEIQQTGMCAQRRIRSAWASAQSDQSLRCALNGWLRIQAFLKRTMKTLVSGRMPRLIWVFAGRTVFLLVWSCRGSYSNTK